MSRDYPNNSDDINDSRSVIERIGELQEEYDKLADAVKESEDEFAELAGVTYDAATAEQVAASEETKVLEGTILERRAALAEWDAADELKELKALAEECEGYSSDWKYGVALIRDSYFEDYAREFADDIGAINKNCSWPYDCVDWERAARELQQDYTAVEWGGVTYWYR